MATQQSQPLASSSKSTLNPYQPLKLTVEKNAKQKYSTTDAFTPGYITSHLKKSKNIDADALYLARVKARQISLDVQNSKTSRVLKAQEEKKERRARHNARKKAGIIGRKEAALRGLWKLHKDQTKYELFLPLHELWLGYMCEMLALTPPPTDPTRTPVLPNSTNIHPKLLKADFHGSIIKVKQSRNPCLVGVTGIVILETENAFRVITKKNEIKLIPKQNSIFTFQIPLYDVRPTQSKNNVTENAKHTGHIELDAIPTMEFELYGEQFRFRAADRASRKFKPKDTIEL